MSCEKILFLNTGRGALYETPLIRNTSKNFGQKVLLIGAPPPRVSANWGQKLD